MSLRDDLDMIGFGKAGSNEVLQAWLRLDAAITPAAIKWLEALPGIMQAYSISRQTKGFKDTQIALNVLKFKLGNALHEAAALHNATDDEKE